MPSKYLPGGKASTEKYIRAEQKNRLERTRLDLSQKFFEKEAFKTKFRIDREKKLLSRAHDLVKRTSGHSDEGCAPTDKYDREYEKSIVFQNGIRLTKLRLTNWRIHEKELLSFLESVQRDTDKLTPGKNQLVRFSDETHAHVPLIKQGKDLSKPKSFESIGSVDSSYQDMSDCDDEGHDSFVDSDDSSEVTLLCGSSQQPNVTTHTPTTARKRVTFVRPHTAGVLLKRTNSNQTPDKKESPPPEDSTHFLITKGGTLINTNGIYKTIQTHNLAKDRPMSAEIKPPRHRRMALSGLQFGQSLDSYRAEVASRDHVFSPCSENSSVSYYLPESRKTRCAPSPLGNLPVQTNLSSGRPNSRLGIFLPPEKEFSRRRSFVSRCRFDSTSETGQEIKNTSQTKPWKSQLILGQSSDVHIRSLGSLTTVLRAALAFSKSRRRNILQGILDDSDREKKNIVVEEKKRLYEIFVKAPEIDMSKLTSLTRN